MIDLIETIVSINNIILFDRLYRCHIDNAEPPIPTEHSLYNSLMVDPIKGSTEINQHDPSLQHTLQCTCSVWDTNKRASQVQRPFRSANWVVGSTPLRSINRPRLTDTTRSNTLDNTDVMEIGR